MNKNQKVAAIIVAAGESKRMGGIDKMFATLGGEPLLMRTTRPFQQCPAVSQIIVVVGGENEPKCRQLMGQGEWSKVTEVCLGGKRRQDSVAAGLKKLKGVDWVIIHDGARPLVTVELIERGLEEARATGAAAAAVPVTDTIKVVDSTEMVYNTPPRIFLRAVQTPQVFRYDIIVKACQRTDIDVTDDTMLVERDGHEVKLYPGSYDNIKITTPSDLALAEVLLKKYER